MTDEQYKVYANEVKNGDRKNVPPGFLLSCGHKVHFKVPKPAIGDQVLCTRCQEGSEIIDRWKSPV